jgi:hypothetical protein
VNGRVEGRRSRRHRRRELTLGERVGTSDFPDIPVHTPAEAARASSMKVSGAVASCPEGANGLSAGIAVPPMAAAQAS